MKKKVDIDWLIRMSIKDMREINNPEAEVKFRTDGYDKYGYGEIECTGRVKNKEKMGDFINTFGRMLAEGEKFDANAAHCIYDNDENLLYKFQVFYGRVFGEQLIILYPDFEKEIHDRWKNEKLNISREDVSDIIQPLSMYN